MFLSFICIVCTLILTTHSTQPNIVYILADDLGYEDVGFQNSDILTPNIDQLAAEGVILENHYVMPLCSLTRASLLTGRYNIHTGYWQGLPRVGAEWALGLNETTVGEMLQGYGYISHMVGKWHVGSHSWDYTPAKRGFETFLGMYLGGGDYFTHICPPVHALDCREDYITPEGVLVDNVEKNLTGQYITDIYTSRAINIIENKPQDKPLFLYLAYTAPHIPLGVPANHYTRHMMGSSKLRRTYAGMVSVMDQGIGEVVRALERAGIRDNTLIVFSSDNGAKSGISFLTGKPSPGSNYPLRGDKGSFFEGGVRGVSFVNSPLLSKTGYVNKNLHHVVDWLPTFEALASQNNAFVTFPKPRLPLDGVNIWNSISNNVSCREEVLIGMSVAEKFINATYTDDVLFHPNFKTQDPQDFSVLRYKNWKILTGIIPSRGWSTSKNIGQPEDLLTDNNSVQLTQLYNLDTDPREQHNVANDHPDVVVEMLSRIGRYDVTPVVKARNSVKGSKGGVWYPWMDTVGDYQVVTNIV